jgi:hypothetical protein
MVHNASSNHRFIAFKEINIGFLLAVSRATNKSPVIPINLTP